MSTRSVSYESDELASLVIMSVSERQDHLHQELPLLAAYQKVHGKSGNTRAGGNKWKADVEVREHATLTGTPTGYEAIGLTGQSIAESMLFSPGFVVAPFMSSKVERAVFNGNSEAKAGIARRAVNMTDAVMRYWHQHSLTGGVAAFVTGQWDTLNGTDYVTAGSAGYIEEDARFSGSNTIGGLARASYLVSGMHNFAYDFAGAMGSNGRLGIIYTLNQMKERASGKQSVACFASMYGATHLARVMHPYYTYTGKDSPDIVGPEFKIMGYDVYSTSHMPNAGTNTTASPWSLLWLDMAHIYPIFLKNDEIDGMFGVTPPTQQHSGDIRVNVGYIDCAGQWYADRFDSSALFHDGEAF